MLVCDVAGVYVGGAGVVGVSVWMWVVLVLAWGFEWVSVLLT